MWRLQPSNMAATVFVLLLAGVRGLQLEDREERICAFSRSPKGAEPVSTNELRGELQENGTIRCSRGSRCYGLWERRADGEMELLNQGQNGFLRVPPGKVPDAEGHSLKAGLRSETVCVCHSERRYAPPPSADTLLLLYETVGDRRQEASDWSDLHPLYSMRISCLVPYRLVLFV